MSALESSRLNESCSSQQLDDDDDDYESTIASAQRLIQSINAVERDVDFLASPRLSSLPSPVTLLTTRTPPASERRRAEEMPTARTPNSARRTAEEMSAARTPTSGGRRAEEMPTARTPTSGGRRAEEIPIARTPTSQEIDQDLLRIRQLCDSVDASLADTSKQVNSSGSSEASNYSTPPSIANVMPPEAIIDLSDTPTMSLGENYNNYALDDDDDVIIVSSNLENIVDLCTPQRMYNTFAGNTLGSSNRNSSNRNFIPIANRNRGCGQRGARNQNRNANNPRSRSRIPGAASRQQNTSEIVEIPAAVNAGIAIGSGDGVHADRASGDCLVTVVSTASRPATARRATPRPTASWHTDSPSKSNSQQVHSHNLTCPVCMDSVLQREPTSTKCGHVFCARCIREAIRVTHKCPLCNTKLNPRTLFRLYL